MPQCCDLRCYSTGMNNGEPTSARGHYLILRHCSVCWHVPELFLHDMEGELPVQVHVVSYYCVWHSHLETRQGFHCCDIDHQLPQTEKMIDTLPVSQCRGLVCQLPRSDQQCLSGPTKECWAYWRGPCRGDDEPYGGYPNSLISWFLIHF